MTGNIKIECQGGTTKDCKIVAGDSEIKYVTEATIRLSPNSIVEGDFHLSGLSIAMEVEAASCSIDHILETNKALIAFGYELKPIDHKPSFSDELRELVEAILEIPEYCRDIDAGCSGEGPLAKAIVAAGEAEDLDAATALIYGDDWNEES